MTLAAGSRLGPYQIESPLGAGGMGEVYAARDTRLNRKVAIKVLPQAVAADPRSRERFDREARSASALNHPNICTVYDVGFDPPFLAMERLDGETLQDRLAAGTIALTALVDVAIGVADALDSAHSQAIVHRDIKPANIFLTRHGPKVLDFGLAKMPMESPAVLSCGPTLAPESRLTDPGSTVGTVAYMSPEQLRGQPLDARTDLFSFGVVLYEMATGRPPFTGGTSAVVAAEILHAHPAAPRQIRPELPYLLEEIISKALEKDRSLRYQHAGDLLADLRRLKRDIASRAGSGAADDNVERPATGSRPAETPRAASPSDSQVAIALLKRHRGAIAGAAGVVALVAAGLFVALRQPPSGLRAAPPSFADLQIEQLTNSGDAERPAISPDGRYVAYIKRTGTQTSVWIRQVSTESNVEIVPAERGVEIEGLTVTPDGDFVDVVRQRGVEHGELWRVPFLGGTPKRLIGTLDSPVGWAPDGHHLAFVRADTAGGRSAIVVGDPDGRSERVLAERRNPGTFLSFLIAGRPANPPVWSPDGQTIAVLGRPDDESRLGIGQIVFVDASTGSTRSVELPGSSFDYGLAWLDSRSLIVDHAGEFAGFRQLWRLSLPDEQLSRLTNDLDSYEGASLTRDRSQLTTGRRETRAGVWVGDAAASQLAETVPMAPFGTFVYSANTAWAGDRLLYIAMTAGHLSVMALVPGAGKSQEIASPAQFVAGSPDGPIVIQRDDGVWRTDRDGAGAVRLTTSGFAPAITRDGRTVVFLSNRSGIQSPWFVPAAGGTPKQIANIAAAILTVDVSPDGRSLVFVSTDEQNHRVLLLCDFPGCTARRMLSTVPITGRVRFTSDGRAVAYIDPASRANLWAQSVDGGPAYQLTHFSDPRMITDFAWSADGRRLAVARATVTNDIVLLKGLRR